ncbi:PREDICTED: chondroitin proteoglycan 2-like [Papilio polytes]|uniref:chondroitin proteoglycan 2-like n=1 Tax=Papilio polytes TaxID=76194 RepID=UPI00067652BA|nr:PREDICTED: chondroitin proteoglycan 2-like [Papilio polytes]
MFKVTVRIGISPKLSVRRIMRGAGIILICAITLTNGYVVDINRNGCPLDYSVERLFEHEYCNKFYQCTIGELVEHTCPEDLLFNIEKNECDWPQNVICGNRVIPDKDDSNQDVDTDGDENSGNCNPSEAPSICATKDSDGILVAHENCNQFYKCSEGVPVPLKCSANLLYNPNKERCDWPENVSCGDRVKPDCSNDGNEGQVEDEAGGDKGTCNCNPGEAASICAAPDTDSILIAHGNCNKFYICAHGKPVAMSCPADLLYDPYREQCWYPEEVDCGDRVIPEDNGNGEGGGGGDGGGGGGGGGGGNGTCNCNPAEAPSICAAKDSDGILIAHENCNQFYKCAHGVPVALSCPGNLFYDPYREQCWYSSQVDCKDRVIPEQDNNGGGGCHCSPREAPSICRAEGSNGILIAHENCHKFYLCSNNVPIEMYCPADLLYDPYVERCGFPEDVICGDRVF